MTHAQCEYSAKKILHNKIIRAWYDFGCNDDFDQFFENVKQCSIEDITPDDDCVDRDSDDVSEQEKEADPPVPVLHDLKSIHKYLVRSFFMAIVSAVLDRFL